MLGIITKWFCWQFFCQNDKAKKKHELNFQEEEVKSEDEKEAAELDLVMFDPEDEISGSKHFDLREEKAENKAKNKGKRAKRKQKKVTIVIFNNLSFGFKNLISPNNHLTAFITLTIRLI